jgi:hypothetical protein
MWWLPGVHGARGAVEIGEVRICAGREERKGVQELLEKRGGERARLYTRCGLALAESAGRASP